MSLHGRIEMMSLSELYQWLDTTRKTGSLALKQAGAERTIFFRQGTVAGATSLAGEIVRSESEVRNALNESVRVAEGEFNFIEAPLPGALTASELQLCAPQVLASGVDQSQGQFTEGPTRGAARGGVTPDAAFAQKLRVSVFERVLYEDFKMPLLPSVAQKMLEITRRENFSLRDLGDVILTDQVIAARVLKLANSGAYGGSRHIDSLPVAVQRLGSQAVANLVLVLSLQSAHGGRDLFLPLRQQLWQHSSACALFARAIALGCRLDRDLAFLCGLMMDFGKLVLLSLIQEIITSQPDGRKPSMGTVEEIIEAFHTKVGGAVSEKWCLPPAVTEAINYHHALSAATEFRAYAAAASLSDQITLLLARNPHLLAEIEAENYACAAEAVQLPAVEMLGLDLAQMEKVIARAPECLKFAQETLA
jgi:HD-like signal output (HDOD) protein